MALHIILSHLGQSDPKTVIGKIPASIKLLAVVSTILLSVNLGLARIYGTYEGYRAPMRIYESLSLGNSNVHLGGPGDTVCYGKDWYRFPTHYFLPNGMRAKFVKSEFDGLLPGEFAEANQAGLGRRPGTWMIPSGMNDENKEDMGKYVSEARPPTRFSSIFQMGLK